MIKVSISSISFLFLTVFLSAPLSYATSSCENLLGRFLAVGNYIFELVSEDCETLTISIDLGKDDPKREPNMPWSRELFLDEVARPTKKFGHVKSGIVEERLVIASRKNGRLKAQSYEFDSETGDLIRRQYRRITDEDFSTLVIRSKQQLQERLERF